MPLLDSFTVDHTRMEAPAVRVAKTMNTPHGDTITVLDRKSTRLNSSLSLHDALPICFRPALLRAE